MNVSFFIPAFNCAKTLAETVASVFSDNFQQGDELVIVNDGSTDDTEVLIQELKGQYPSVRSISHSFNKGGGAARNTAVENAEYDILFCLDSDNVLERASIPRLKQFLLENDADVAAFGELWYFVKSTREVTHKWIFKAGQMTLADYLAGSVVAGASGNYMFTRKSWLQASRYPEFAGALDAWGFGLRQVATGQKMMVLPASHYYHRYGHESYWVRESKQGKNSLTALQLIIPFIDELAEQDKEYIFSRRGRRAWFDRLDKRPLRLKSGETGTAGVRAHPDSERAMAGPKPCLLSAVRRLKSVW